MSDSAGSSATPREAHVAPAGTGSAQLGCVPGLASSPDSLGSTGAAAALQASVRLPDVKAIVSRGGGPDLAWAYLDRVTAPTLLIVGGNDEEVIELNRRALERLNQKREEKRNELVLVPGATHLFEEPGTLEEVARLATNWFLKFLA